MSPDPDTDVKTFRESAISPSRLRSFLFCEAQPLARQATPRPHTSETVKTGSVRHQLDLSWQIERLGQLEPVEVHTVGEALGYLKDALRGALWRKIVLANTFEARTFASIVPEIVPGRGLLGYPTRWIVGGYRSS